MSSNSLNIGTPLSNPHKYLATQQDLDQSLACLYQNDFQNAIITAFHLSKNDGYVYHATASVSLSQAQRAINAGTSNGLCDWYLSPDGISLGNPPPSDITAYITLFSPQSSAPNALKSLSANAKKASLRAEVASHLVSKRHINSTKLTPIPKLKPNKSPPFFNPYFDFWAWSCHALGWGGPTASTANVKLSHAVLPVLMHHFGCMVPSYEALALVKQVAGKRVVCDMGSGNGYWAFMLRQLGLTVHAVDSRQSVFRAEWIRDTIATDGERWLKGRGSAKDDVLLMVYPVVGGDFLGKMLGVYKGDTVCIAGTQCENGYTGLKDRVVDEYMKEVGTWDLSARVALPSFAGKDEALFIFQRK